jgi:PPE-repeat protein
MDFLVMPPEVNSARIYFGEGRNPKYCAGVAGGRTAGSAVDFAILGLRDWSQLI